MKRLITGLLLLACLCVGALSYGGEDAGLAGAAYKRGLTKNSSNQVSENLIMADDYLIEAATGTTSNLAFRFRGDTNTGIFSDGADRISFQTGGTVRLLMHSSGLISSLAFISGNNGDGAGQISGLAGTNAAPAFTFNSNTTTGLGRNAVGQPSMIASSTEIQRWTDRQIYEPLINTGGIFISHTSIKGYRLTTDAAATRITVDGAADGAANRWGIASGTTLTGQVYVSGIATDTTRASVGYVIGFKAKRVNSTVTVAACSTEIIEDASLTGCSAEVLADSTNGAFYVSVVGSTTTNIRWGAVAKYMEVNQP